MQPGGARSRTPRPWRFEDILVTLTTQHHPPGPIAAGEGLFLYLVLSRDRGNLALARRALSDIERSLVV